MHSQKFIFEKNTEVKFEQEKTSCIRLMAIAIHSLHEYSDAASLYLCNVQQHSFGALRVQRWIRVQRDDHFCVHRVFKPLAIYSSGRNLDPRSQFIVPLNYY